MREARAWDRDGVRDLLRLSRPYACFGHTEMDVTEALANIARLRRQQRRAMTLHCAMIYWLARAAMRNPEVLTYRHGARLVTHEHANICTVIRQRSEGAAERLGLHVIRSAHTKDMWQIQEELRAAMRTPWQPPRRNPITRLARRLRYRRMKHDPDFLNRHLGNFGLTNLSLAGLQAPLHGVGTLVHTFGVGIGSVVSRRCIDADGRVLERKVMTLTGGFDHVILDGMAAVRFGNTLAELVGASDGLGGGDA